MRTGALTRSRRWRGPGEGRRTLYRVLSLARLCAVVVSRHATTMDAFRGLPVAEMEALRAVVIRVSAGSVLEVWAKLLA